MWVPGGAEIFYVGGDNRLMVARVETGSDVVVRDRSPLFGLTPFEWGLGGFASFDVVPGGDRLLMVAEASAGEAGRRVVVLNVFEELDTSR